MIRISSALALLTFAGSASAQATFRGLGYLPGGLTYSEGHSLSADGLTAGGGSKMTGGIPGTLGAYAWTAELGMTPLFPPPGPNSVAAAISADGSVLAGWADYGSFSPLGAQGFFWTSATGAVLIGDLPTNPGTGLRSFVRAISAAGNILAGDGTSAQGIEAFIYRRDTQQFTPLGSLSTAAFGSWSYDITPDGSVVVGGSYAATNQLQAFRWSAATGMVGLPYLQAAPGVTPWSQAEAISANGAVIVGQCRSNASANALEACKWTKSGVQGIGDLPGGAFQSYAYGVSADGSIIVGRATIEGIPGPFGGGSAPRAFIWDSANGIRDLQAVLIAAGAELTGWSLHEARGISADGTALTGTGISSAGQFEAWYATLPRTTCYANCDGSTGAPVLTGNDFQCFINRFAAGSASANCDGSTLAPVLTANDFQCFLDAFVAGCP